MYDEKKDKSAANEVAEFEPFDDFTLVPQDKEGIYDHVDHSVELNMKMDNLNDGAN